MLTKSSVILVATLLLGNIFSTYAQTAKQTDIIGLQKDKYIKEVVEATFNDFSIYIRDYLTKAPEVRAQAKDFILNLYDSRSRGYQQRFKLFDQQDDDQESNIEDVLSKLSSSAGSVKVESIALKGYRQGAKLCTGEKAMNI